MKGEDKEPKICSFCGRSSDEVENMVTGPGVYICSECIDICHNILLEERKNKAKQGKEPADTKVPTPEEIKNISISTSSSRTMPRSLWPSPCTITTNASFSKAKMTV